MTWPVTLRAGRKLADGRPNPGHAEFITQVHDWVQAHCSKDETGSLLADFRWAEGRLTYIFRNEVDAAALSQAFEGALA